MHAEPVPAAAAPSKADIALASGLEHFQQGDFERAYPELSAHLVETGSGHLVRRPADEENGRFGRDSSSDAIRGYLERRRADWNTGQTAWPRFLAQRPSSNPRRLQEAKLLLVFSRYICNDSRFMQNDMIDHFYETAMRAGIDTDVFFVDECSYPGLAPTPPQQAIAKLEEMKRYVAESKPSFIFFDAQYIGVETTLNAPFMEEIRRLSGARAIGAMCDAWDSVCVPMADYWLPAIDAMYHFAPGSPMERPSIAPDKLIWSGYPVNRAQFYNAPDKDLAISFSGTYPFGNRPFWISAAASAARELNLQNISIKAHDRQQNDAATMDEYAAVMRRSKIVLNLPARHNGKFAVTGRIWQALHCGALLLEEHTELTEAYFVPYVHYVPFRSAEELTRLIHFFHENEREARRIGDNAAEFMASEYAEARIWGDILGHEFRGPAASVEQLT